MIGIRLHSMRAMSDSILVLMLAAAFLLPVGVLRAQGDPFAPRRQEMVDQQIRRRSIADPKVLSAMATVPRHLFVPETYRDQAYDDYPLPIGSRQTISQPYIVALMTSLLDLKGGERVLEIGTGSGYQAAVLAQIASKVYTVEIISELADRARKTLADLGYDNIEVRTGDGWEGWAEHAPFDGILVTAAPPRVPEPLLQQLKVGGHLVVPVGSFFQDLVVYTRTADGFEKRNVIPVRFVPMTGEAQKSDPPKP